MTLIKFDVLRPLSNTTLQTLAAPVKVLLTHNPFFAVQPPSPLDVI